LNGELRSEPVGLKSNPVLPYRSAPLNSLLFAPNFTYSAQFLLNVSSPIFVHVPPFKQRLS